MRGIRKSRREFGYFFREYRFYIISIIVVLLLFLGYKGYNYFNDKLKIYKQNEWIGYNNYISITNSYYNIDNDNNYVIIKFDIYKAERMAQLNVGNINLLIGDKKYNVNKNICYNFNSLGNCYKKQYITNDVKNYIITFIVDDIDLRDSYIVYSDSYDVNYKVKLNLESYER